MEQIVAYYNNPLTKDKNPIVFVSGTSAHNFLFNIEGEITNFGLLRLVELDDQNKLTWDNSEMRLKFHQLAQTLDSKVDSGIIVFDEEAVIESKEQVQQAIKKKEEETVPIEVVENSSKMFILTVVAGTLLLATILSTYFLFF